MQKPVDVVVVGGGAVGLSIAWRLAAERLSVTVLDKGEPGRESSWAGAGIVYPGNFEHAASPYDRLMALSARLHPEWAAELRELTGIDNGYLRCGELALATDEPLERTFAAEAEHRAAERVEVERLTPAGLRTLEPELTGPWRAGWLYPGAAQVRNPRHGRALAEACRLSGVTVRAGCPALRLARDGDRVTGVWTAEGLLPAAHVIVCAGAWSESLLSEAGVNVRIKPIRGQIVLVATPKPLISHIVECGPRYLVPRPDGKLLIGSTEEDVGFVKANTPGTMADLISFARTMVPGVAAATFETAWSGFRPHAGDGKPYIGAVRRLPGLLVASGHFRHGLHLSPATAVVIRDLILGRAPAVDLSEFRPDRHSA
jgi:glycine oxidase